MEALNSGDSGLRLAELEQVSAAQLWPREGTLRALAGLLTAEEPEVSKAAANYLSSAAAHAHFRNKVRCGGAAATVTTNNNKRTPLLTFVVVLLCDRLCLQKGVNDM